MYIKQRLAEMKADCRTPDQLAYYKQFSDFYGVDVEVKVVKEPKKEEVKVVEEKVEEKIADQPVTETVVTEVPKKKGRPSKVKIS